jgi:pimeloyl-ACP methyl ester carboxylesterase
VKELSLGAQDFALKALVSQNSYTIRAAAAAAAPRIAGVEECWLEVDGVQMRYLKAGSGPPLILLHGLLGYSFSWRFTMPALAKYATLYAPDMPGSGFSERPPNLDCCMSAAARRLLRFAGQLGLQCFDLLGTSHGGSVAMLSAAQAMQPESALRVRRLILVAPVNPYSAHGRRLAPFFGTSFGSALFRNTIGRMTFLYRYWLMRLYGGPGKQIPPGTLDGYMAQLAIPGLFEHALSIVRTWTADLRELEAILPKLVDIPALLMWGSDDPAVYASSAKSMAKHFRSCETVVFPGVGHLPYEETPDQFNRTLIQFLQPDEAKILQP